MEVGHVCDQITWAHSLKPVTYMGGGFMDLDQDIGPTILSKIYSRDRNNRAGTIINFLSMCAPGRSLFRPPPHY